MKKRFLTPFFLLAATLAAEATLGGCRDRGKTKPTLRMYCGGTMRRPIEQLIREFERANEVRIDPQYGGCGMLVGQMKAGAGGDVYYACDGFFMDEARRAGAIDETYPVANVTHFKPVIMVKKGNPHGIRTVQDLGRPGLKVGLGNESHGSVGHTGWAMVRAAPNAEAIIKNVSVNAVTADILATQLAEGPLDAVIIWDVLARPYADKADVCEVSAPQADQPIAVMKDSAHPELARKFIEFIRSEHARQVFREHGFIVDAPATRPSARP